MSSGEQYQLCVRGINSRSRRNENLLFEVMSQKDKVLSLEEIIEDEFQEFRVKDISTED